MSNALEVQNENDLMLSTKDNPYNPKTEYDKWRQWDISNGYDTEAFIARMLYFDGDDIDVDDELAIADATNKVIREILEHDLNNTYILV